MVRQICQAEVAETGQSPFVILGDKAVDWRENSAELSVDPSVCVMDEFTL